MKKLRINKWTKAIIRFLSVIILLVLVYMPIEQWIFRFETPEEALCFDYTAKAKKIIRKLETKDVALITYEKRDGTLEQKYLGRDDRGWKTPIRRFIRANKFKTSFYYSIVSYPEKDKSVLIISSSSIDEENVIKKVSDSIGTDFQSDSYERRGNQFTFYGKDWIGIVEKYPKDYKIYLNDETIEL